MSRDAKLILAANALRNFGYGMLDVLFVLYLTALGLDAISIGVLITATLIGSAILNLTVGVFADQVGRRRIMGIMTMIMVLSGSALIFVDHFALLLVVSLTGTLNFTAVSTGAFVGMDQATLPQLSPVEDRNRVFGVYNTAALLARMVGALISSVPNVLEVNFGLPLVDGYRLAIASFALLGLTSLVFIVLLSPAVELIPKGEKTSNSIFSLGRSKKRVLRMSALFGIDAFTSGLVANSLIVLLFYQRFGVGAEIMGPVYSVARLLQALSYQVAVRFANRFGLLNTMVFTHLPSQFLIMALPFAPTLPIGVLILLLRQSLSHMDLPTRQAYLAEIVEPGERISAAGITNLTRNLTQGVSPTFTGIAYQVLSYSLPFLSAGVLGIVYDAGMYFSFRRIRPEREQVVLSSETT